MGQRISSLLTTIRNSKLLSVGLLGLLPAIPALLPQPAYGQATTTASKTMDISFFGGYSATRPDYGPQVDNGVTVGANVTRYYRYRVKPSLETRFGFANGPTVNEQTYLFGFRGQMDYGRVHPYADVLFGLGNIHYNFIVDPRNPKSGLNDDSVVESPGVGLDIDVYRQWQVKADYQYQFWNLGTNDSLSPSVFTVGVTYRIPFRPHFDKAVH